MLFSGSIQQTASKILRISSVLTFPFESISRNSYQTPKQEVQENYSGIMSTGDTVSAAYHKI